MTTKCQIEFLDYLAGQHEKGIFPSYQEIADALDYSSKSNVSRIVDDLVASQHLIRTPGKTRSLEIIRQPGELSSKSSMTTASLLIYQAYHKVCKSYGKSSSVSKKLIQISLEIDEAMKLLELEMR